MDEPFVTVITPTHNLLENNQADAFNLLVELLDMQTYPNIEHLIMDNASTDGTVEFLKDYKNQGYLNFFSEKDTGKFSAYNRGVMHAKGLLYDYLKEHEGLAFVNADDHILEGMLWERELESVPYGMEGVKVLPSSATDPFLRLVLPGGRTVKTTLVGAYNAANVLAALKVGWFFGVHEDDAIKAVEAYVPSNNRSQLMRTGRNTLIVDAYNANPSSMAVALDNLALCEGRKVALLGDMRELGADSAAEHKKIVDRLLSVISSEAEKSQAILVGPEFKKAAEGTGIPVFDTSDALAEWLKTNPIEGCTILVKGSRGIQMEKVISTL
jgi:UDP-N-acetylmuramoyl-tripeptide--D-alanyl-D-alanine ligase